ncbi:hypothetical protein ACOMHN_064274 [Nucella lapillus]
MGSKDKVVTTLVIQGHSLLLVVTTLDIQGHSLLLVVTTLDIQGHSLLLVVTTLVIQGHSLLLVVTTLDIHGHSRLLVVTTLDIQGHSRLSVFQGHSAVSFPVISFGWGHWSEVQQQQPRSTTNRPSAPVNGLHGSADRWSRTASEVANSPLPAAHQR